MLDDPPSVPLIKTAKRSSLAVSAFSSAKVRRVSLEISDVNGEYQKTEDLFGGLVIRFKKWLADRDLGSTSARRDKGWTDKLKGNRSNSGAIDARFEIFMISVV